MLEVIVLGIVQGVTELLPVSSKLFAIGLIASFVTGFIAIKFLLNFLRRHPLNIFAYYRFALSLVIIAGIWLKG